MCQAAVLADRAMRVIEENHSLAITYREEQRQNLAGIPAQLPYLMRTAAAEEGQGEDVYPHPVEQSSDLNGRLRQ